MAQASEVQTRFRVIERSLPGDSIVAIELGGQLDAHTAWEFERFLERVVRAERKHHIVLDFHDLEYISSAGLGVLMGLIEEVRAAGGGMKLAALPEKIFHVLDLVGFPMEFQIFPTVLEGQKSF